MFYEHQQKNDWLGITVFSLKYQLFYTDFSQNCISMKTIMHDLKILKW